ncbi:MAG: DMT family transporter [Eubacteriales bacterium]|nr:DMT family transporter [Eubacteriales bacterium]
MKNLKGTLILLVTALVWGLGFAAQSAAADHVGSFAFTAVRSLLAASFLALLLAGRRLFFGKTPPRATETVGRGAILGVLLFIAANLQQFGIAAYPDGAAAAGRAGFLTATYVVMVALWGLIRGRKLHPVLWLSIALCLGGMYLLCCSDGFDRIYTGDLLVFACAVGFTVYILYVDRCRSCDGLLLSCIQFAVCGALSLVFSLPTENLSVPALTAAWLPLLYAGLVSSGVGYTLQIIGQKFAEPAVASIVMSLESVFGALAGWVLLHENLGSVELLGCALVFAAVIAAQTPELLALRKEKHERILS